MTLSRRLMPVGRQELPQKHDFGWINGVSFINQEMHLAAKQHETALALIDAADKAPPFAGLDVDRGLEHGGVNGAAKQARLEHLDAILFHDLTMTSQQPLSKP